MPGETLELPIGLQATDRFIDKLRTMAGVKVPDAITDERGRLLDMISDMHQYFTASGSRCMAIPTNWFR